MKKLNMNQIKNIIQDIKSNLDFNLIALKNNCDLIQVKHLQETIKIQNELGFNISLLWFKKI